MLYRIGKIDGTCNCEFFRSFYLEEFEARDDADAFAERAHIEKETSDGWIEVEY